MTLLCAVCGLPVTDESPYQVDMDGDAVHLACLEIVEVAEDEEEER